MKSVKLFATIAMSAMFVACAQEELFKADNAPQQMDKVVGHQLLGTDVALNATLGVSQTRLASTGWEATDEIGLGWLTYGGPATPQSIGQKPVSDHLYANHQFVWDQDGEKFASKGNIYVGWYFGYYPWSYEPQSGVIKTIEVNPAQKTKVWKDRLSQNLHISPLYFIGKDQLDPNTYELTVPVELQNAVNNLIVTSSPLEGSAFDPEKGELGGLKIESITINVDQDVFAKTFTLNASKLATTNEGLTESLAAALGTDARTKTVTTNVEAAGFTAGETANMVTIVAPTTPAAKLDAKTLSIQITVEGGSYFIIDYTAEAEEGSAYEANNNALLALAEAYNGVDTKAGLLTKPQTKENLYAQLNVKLFDAIFVPNFDDIKNIAEWNAAVLLADKLDRNDLVFKIHPGSKIEFTTEENGGIVTDENGVATLNAPKNGVTVSSPGIGSGHCLLINGAVAWNANIKSVGAGVGIVVGENGVLDVDGRLTASSIINNGVINTTPNTFMTNHNHSGVVNNGRINIEYGAKLELNTTASAEDHIIAYNVIENNTEADEYSRIKDLVATSGNDHGHAFVNTLVIDNDFNLQKDGNSSSTDQGSYNDTTTPGSDAVVVGEGISLEITDAVVEGPSSVTVKNVTLTNGTLKGVNVNGSVNVNVEQEETVEYDGLLDVETITGTVTAYDCTVIATSIDGTVNAKDATIETTSVTGDIIAVNTTVTATDGVIKGSVNFNGGSIDAATITGTSVTIDGTTTIENAEITAPVTIVGGEATLENVKINGILTIKKGAKVIINSEELMMITEIINDGGELVSDNDIKVENIILQNQSKTTLGEGWDKTVWYTDNYVHNNSQLNGYVKKADAVEYDENKTAAENGAALKTLLYEAEAGDFISLPEGEFIYGWDGSLTKPVSIVSDGIVGLVSSYRDRLQFDLDEDGTILLKNIKVLDVDSNFGSEIWIKANHTKNQKVILENVECDAFCFDNAYLDGAVIDVELKNCKIGTLSIIASTIAGKNTYSYVKYDSDCEITTVRVENNGFEGIANVRINGSVPTNYGVQ